MANEDGNFLIWVHFGFCLQKPAINFTTILSLALGQRLPRVYRFVMFTLTPSTFFMSSYEQKAMATPGITYTCQTSGSGKRNLHTQNTRTAAACHVVQNLQHVYRGCRGQRLVAAQ